MKINFSTIVCAYVTLMVSDPSSTQQIKECYSCDTSKLSECEAKPLKCVDTKSTAAPGIATSEAEAPPVERLLERQGVTEEYTGPTLPVAIPDGRMPVLAFKCLTITGKPEEKGDVMMWKGCAYSCDKTIDTGRTSFPVEEKCEFCDDKDLCNSSARIEAIRWMFLIVSMIYVLVGISSKP